MPKILDLAIGRRTCRVARQTALAGLQELLGPSVIKALGNAFTAAQLGNAGLAAQAIQNYPDLLFGRMTLAGCPADVLHDPLRRRFRVYGFLSHLHSLMVTMSQKSSVPQAAKSVSQALMPDTLFVREAKRAWLFVSMTRMRVHREDEIVRRHCEELLR